MKGSRLNLFWGIVLIIAGGFVLARNFDLVPDFSEQLWGIIFGVLAVIFLGGYLAGDRSNWGLLFPGVGCGAIALTFWLTEAGVNDNIVGGLFLVAISLPFWAGYLVNRQKNWGALIPGWALLAIGVIVLFVDAVNDELIGSLVMFAIALPFFVVFLINRTYWWALIPGWVLAAIGFIILLAGSENDELIGSLVMFAIALPFFVVYLINRMNWWALIPAWVLTAIGLIILLATSGEGELIGALVMFAIALPFFLVYMRNREQWWALIPAGIMSSIGVTVLLALAGLTESLEDRLMGGVLFAGIGLTFAYLWTLRGRQETDWAKYPAACLGVAALLVLTVGAEIEVVWSIVFIGLGVWLLLRSPRPKTRG